MLSSESEANAITSRYVYKKNLPKTELYTGSCLWQVYYFIIQRLQRKFIISFCYTKIIIFYMEKMIFMDECSSCEVQKFFLFHLHLKAAKSERSFVCCLQLTFHNRKALSLSDKTLSLSLPLPLSLSLSFSLCLCLHSWQLSPRQGQILSRNRLDAFVEWGVGVGKMARVALKEQSLLWRHAE